MNSIEAYIITLITQLELTGEVSANDITFKKETYYVSKAPRTRVIGIMDCGMFTKERRWRDVNTLETFLNRTWVHFV